MATKKQENSKSTKTLDRYIVTQRNEEYNDEGYDITEGYQVYQNKIFTDKTKAQRIADELNFEFFCDMRPCDYGGGDCVRYLEDYISGPQYKKLTDTYCEISEVIDEKDMKDLFNKVKKHTQYFSPFSVLTLEEDDV